MDMVVIVIVTVKVIGKV